MDLQLETAGSIPAAALMSMAWGKLFTYIYQRQKQSKQAHHAKYWHRIYGPAASGGVWLRAIESEISADQWAKWLGRDFTF